MVHFITVVFDERVFSYLLPVWPFVGLKDYQEFYEVIGFVGGRMAIDSLWFWVLEQSFGLYLVIESAGSERIVGIDSIQHLEEDNAE